MPDDVNGASFWIVQVAPAAFLLVAYVVAHAYTSACLYMIARKADPGERLWQAWVPVANVFLMCRLVDVPAWWAWLCLVPWAGSIPGLWLMVQLPKAVGRAGRERLLVLVPVVNLIYMGYVAFIARAGRRVAAFEGPEPRS